MRVFLSDSTSQDPLIQSDIHLHDGAYPLNVVLANDVRARRFSREVEHRKSDLKQSEHNKMRRFQPGDEVKIRA
jgi:hypothetical protein